MTTITKVSIEEAAILSNLAAFTFQEAWSEPGNADDLNNYIDEYFNELTIRSELENPEIGYFIITDDDVNAGYMKLEFNCQPEGHLLQSTVALHRLYVKASHRNLKLETHLMNYAFSEAIMNGSKTIWLGVWNENYAAMRFYERFGFKRFGNYQFVMGTIVSDDYLMKRSLF